MFSHLKDTFLEVSELKFISETMSFVANSKVFTCARILLVMDIVRNSPDFIITRILEFLLCLLIPQFRGMLFAAILVGLFCGMATVYVEKLPEVILPDSTTRVDYYKNRKSVTFSEILNPSK